jgi:hypothetical protein
MNRGRNSLLTMSEERQLGRKIINDEISLLKPLHKFTFKIKQLLLIVIERFWKDRQLELKQT